MKKGTFTLWGNCFLVEGYYFSLIVDLQKERFMRIPNFFILDFKEEKFVPEICSELHAHDYGFYTETPQLFPKINTEIANPYDLFLLHIRVDSQEIDTFDWSILGDIRIKCLSVTFENEPASALIEQVSDRIQALNVESVQLIFSYPEPDFGAFLDVFNRDDKLSRIFSNSVIQHCIVDRIEYYNLDHAENYINRIIVNTPVFSESKTNNVFYNKTLSIFTSGYFENQGGERSVLNNQTSAKLMEDNQLLWDSNKELTDICKSCEYRRVCIDKRLPKKREDGTWYHQTTCNYNPYIAKWKGEAGYVPITDCGIISVEDQFHLDHEQLSRINLELWEQ